MDSSEQSDIQEEKDLITKPHVSLDKRIAEFFRKNPAIITITLTVTIAVLTGMWGISEWQVGKTTKLIEFMNSTYTRHVERLDTKIEQGFSDTRKEFSEVRKEIQGVREDVKDLHGEINYIRGHISKTEENNSDHIVYLDKQE